MDFGEVIRIFSRRLREGREAEWWHCWPRSNEDDGLGRVTRDSGARAWYPAGAKLGLSLWDCAPKRNLTVACLRQDQVDRLSRALAKTHDALSAREAELQALQRETQERRSNQKQLEGDKMQ